MRVVHPILAFNLRGDETVARQFGNDHPGTSPDLPCLPEGRSVLGPVNQVAGTGHGNGIGAAAPSGVVHVVSAVFTLDDMEILAAAFPLVFLPFVVVGIQNGRRMPREVRAVRAPRHADAAGAAPLERRVLVIGSIEEMHLAVSHHGGGIVNILRLPPNFLAEDGTLEAGVRCG